MEVIVEMPLLALSLGSCRLSRVRILGSIARMFTGAFGLEVGMAGVWKLRVAFFRVQSVPPGVVLLAGLAVGRMQVRTESVPRQKRPVENSGILSFWAVLRPPGENDLSRNSFGSRARFRGNPKSKIQNLKSVHGASR